MDVFVHSWSAGKGSAWKLVIILYGRVHSKLTSTTAVVHCLDHSSNTEAKVTEFPWEKDHCFSLAGAAAAPYRLLLISISKK